MAAPAAAAAPTERVILKGSEEAATILKIYHPTIGENETWAILDAKWYHGWARYSGINTDRKTVTEETGAPRPGPVDNTRLQSTTEAGMLKTDISEGQDYVLVHIDVWNKYMEWYGGGPAFIRGTIAQGHQRIIRVEMYPVFLQIHEVKGESAGETSKLQSFSGRYSINDIIKTLQPAVAAAASPAATTGDASTAAAATTPAATATEAENKDATPTIRIWMWEEPPEEKKDTAAAAAAASTTTPTPAAAPGGPEAAATSAPATDAAAPVAAESEKPKRKKDNWRLLEGGVSLSTPLDGLGIEKTKPIKVLVERVAADGSWPRAAYVKDWKDFEVGDHVDCQDTVGKWYESKVRDVKPDTVYIHFLGWAESWDEWIPRNSTRLAAKNAHTTGPRAKPAESSGWGGMTWSYGTSEEGRPGCSGAVGLRNLGNTCFMNSTLACLGHSPSLTDYFLDDRYLAEINRDNPLGWKGKVAEEYGLMTKEVWSDKYTTVAPKKFKDAIGQFAPRFSGYQQQDSSELLSFLLDGLHEDLNRIVKKPSTPAVESKGRPDTVVADESWVNYKRRNDSVIVDLMQGQLKSRLECPQSKCGRVSITFDPFMFLSAPLPTIVDKVQEVVLVSATVGRPLTIYGCTVSTHGRVGDLRKALSDVSGIPLRRLVIAELWSGRVYRFMEDDIGLNEIRPNEHIYAYEVVQMDEFKGDAVCVQIINQKMEKNPAYDPSWPASREYISEVFGLPRVFCVPRRSQLTNRQLRALVSQTMSPTHPAGETPFKICALQSDARNCLKCGYTSSCAGCETPDDDVAFDMGDRDAKAAFALQWTNSNVYNAELDKAVRDKTADISVIKRESTIDLGDCLRSFTKQETLSESDPWYCSDCKEFRQAYKKFDIWSLPSLLVIHLKRFQYTRTWRDKLSTFVDFPVEGLDMGQFCVNPEFKGDKGIYDLYGVSNHMGNMGGGHYTAYVKNMSSGKWYCHDDSRVYPVNVSEIKSSSAYVLFYKRRTLPASKRAVTGAADATPTATTPTAAAAPATNA